jgi:hypothetical protein
MNYQLNSSRRPIGVCPLCREEKELRDSHLLPAFGYKAVRNSEWGPPVLVTPKTTMNKDFQIRDYLLCNDCEQRFGKEETYVSSLVKRSDGHFPFLEYRKRAVLATRFEHGGLYRYAGIKEVAFDRLAYFAASVIWRGSVHSWPGADKDRFRPTPLDSPFEDQFRAYLHGEDGFPVDAVLWIELRANEPGVAMTAPVRSSRNALVSYSFELLAIKFIFLLGTDFTHFQRTMCALRGDRNPVIVIDEPTAPPDRAKLNTMATSRVTKRIAERFGKK